MRIRALAPVGMILTPAKTMRDLADGPWGRGVAPTVGLGMAWGCLSLILGLLGKTPSGPVTPPFSASGYYLWQAVFLPFLLLALWRLQTWTTAILARSLNADRPDHDSEALANVLGYAYGVPVLVSLVLPDVLTLWLLGFERLSSTLLYTAPLTLCWTLGLCTLGARTVYGMGWIRSLTSALGGLMAHALVGALWIR